MLFKTRNENEKYDDNDIGYKMLNRSVDIRCLRQNKEAKRKKTHIFFMAYS